MNDKNNNTPPSGGDDSLVTEEVESTLSAFWGGQINPYLTETLVRIDSAYNRQFRAAGIAAQPNGLAEGAISFGFIDIDDATLGMQPGDLVVISGRPSAGTTTLALNIAQRFENAKDAPVLIATPMISGAQIAHRLLAAASMVSSKALAIGTINDDHWPRITSGFQRMHDAKIIVADRVGLAVADVKQACEQVAQVYGRVGMIVIDALPMLLHNTREATGLQDLDVVSPLKNLARAYQCPLLLTTPADKAVDLRKDKRPHLRDLMPPTQLPGELADIVLFVYRDNLYDRHSPDEGTVEVIAAKSAGPGGVARLTMIHDYSLMDNYSREPIFKD